MDVEIHALLSSTIDGVGVQLHMSVALMAAGKFK
jgi:GH35 family endo-1,4-beta-xylanase